MVKLSVVLATRNEEANIGRCLESVRNIADEMIVVDEYSIDKTREIAKSFGAKVFLEEHHDIFHITKQKALDKASGDWVLQLDADEVATPELAKEIKQIMSLTDKEIESRQNPSKLNEKLFRNHQRLIEERDGKIGSPEGGVAAFFIPRRNIFLGKPLKYAGVYPDGVIRLVKNGKARFPQKSVHEQIEVWGAVSWLFNDLEHHDSPTFRRYLSRLNRYTDLIAQDYDRKRVGVSLLSFIDYVLIKPSSTFVSLYIRHKGFLDGPTGFLWSFFSSLRFSIAYFKYVVKKV